MSNITKAIAALGVVAGLGVAALPLSTYAATSRPVKVSAEINSSISVAASTTDASIGTLVKNGDVKTSNNVDITVTTTNATGYTLTVQDTDTDNNLTSLGTDGLVAASIKAGTPAKGTSNWGITGGKVTGWGVVPASNGTALELNSTSEAPADGSDIVTVKFGASASNSQADGTYSTDVVFTAIANA